MGNPTGQYKNLTPILGSSQQQQFLQTIASQAFNQRPGGNTIQGITPYGGQLTPNLSQMMLSGVDATWNPNSPGMPQMQQQYGNILNQQNQVNAMNPLSMLQRYAGGAPMPTNPYGGMMAPQTPNYGYQYQQPDGQGNMGGGPSPGGGGSLQQSPVAVQFNQNTPAQTPPSQPTAPVPNVPYQSITDPSLLPGQLGGPGGGSMSTLAWQQMMGGQPTTQPGKQPTMSSGTARTAPPTSYQSPFVNYNPAFSAASWGTGYSPSFV